MQPHLMLVRSILKGLAVGPQPDTPARRDHLPAHFIRDRRTQSRVRKVSIIHSLGFDIAFADTQPLGQILACFLDCLFFAQSHETAGSFLGPIF